MIRARSPRRPHTKGRPYGQPAAAWLVSLGLHAGIGAALAFAPLEFGRPGSMPRPEPRFGAIMVTVRQANDTPAVVERSQPELAAAVVLPQTVSQPEPPARPDRELALLPALTAEEPPAKEADGGDSVPTGLQVPVVRGILAIRMGEASEAASSAGAGDGSGWQASEVVPPDAAEPTAGPTAAAGGYVQGATPECLVAPRPAYPELARRMGWSGLVVLRVHVARDGSCSAATVRTSSGYAVLDQAAAAAVKAWRFKPAVVAGVAVEADLEIPIRFKLVN